MKRLITTTALIILLIGTGCYAQIHNFDKWQMYKTSESVVLKSSQTQSFEPTSNYEIVKSYQLNGLCDINNNIIYYYDAGFVKGMQAQTEETVFTSEKLEIFNHYPSFIEIDPQNNWLYYGFTIYGNTDDRIYRVDLTNGSWSHVATLPCNFDAEVYQGKLLVSGLGYSNWNGVDDTNGIWLVDMTGNNQHVKIIEIPGNSTGLAIDSQGNIVCGQYSIPEQGFKVFRWNAYDVYIALQRNLTLTTAQAQTLSTMASGIYDCEFDATDHLFWNTNNFTSDSQLAQWNGLTTPGDNGEVIASQPTGGWLNMIKSSGKDLFVGGTFEGLTHLRPTQTALKASHKSFKFISEVVDYVPAPGQFVNDPSWGSATTAASLINTATGHMSLGSYGGYVVFKFAEPVKNDPANPYGVDFTIFGNPIISNIYNKVTWSEPGVVSVMKDKNGNGQPDDTWYELAGSDYYFSSTIKNYQVTYTNPKQSVAVDVPWTDNQGGSGVVEANNFHKQPYYPSVENFPQVNQNAYTLSGTRLQDVVNQTNPSYVIALKRGFGYADNQARNTATREYNVPDNPYTPIAIEGAGGDAFDINWAVDAHGNYVNLDQIDFIKVHNGNLAQAGWLGEMSTEVGGAVDIDPISGVTGITESVVIGDLPPVTKAYKYPLEVFAFTKGRLKTDQTIRWSLSQDWASIDASNILHVTQAGELEITATLVDNPAASYTVSTTIDLTGVDEPTGIDETTTPQMTLTPNPVRSHATIKNAQNASVKIFDITGELVMQLSNYSQNSLIDFSAMHSGLYIIQLNQNDVFKTFKFIKQ